MGNVALCMSLSFIFARKLRSSHDRVRERSHKHTDGRLLQSRDVITQFASRGTRSRCWRACVCVSNDFLMTILFEILPGVWSRLNVAITGIVHVVYVGGPINIVAALTQISLNCTLGIAHTCDHHLRPMFHKQVSIDNLAETEFLCACSEIERK